MVKNIDLLLKKNTWFENPIFITGLPKSGTTLLMNLLDGHKEYLAMPFEPAFPEMLRFKRYYKNTNQMFWDWILELPYYLHLTWEYSKYYNKGFYKRTGILPNDKKINWKLVKKFCSSRKIKLKESIGIDFEIYEYIKYFRDLDDDYKPKNEKELILLNLLSLKKYCIYNNYETKGWIFKNPSLRPFDTRAIDNFKKSFPGGKVVLIVRDPKAYFLSIRKTIYKKKRNNEGMNNFVWSFFRELNMTEESYHELVNNNIFSNKDFYFLKYEDLVSDPRNTIIKMCKYINIGFDEIFLKPTIFEKQINVITARIKSKNIISIEAMNKWKKELNFLTIFIIDCLSEKFLLKYSYKYSNLAKYKIFRIIGKKFYDFLYILILLIFTLKKNIPIRKIVRDH